MSSSGEHPVHGRGQAVSIGGVEQGDLGPEAPQAGRLVGVADHGPDVLDVLAQERGHRGPPDQAGRAGYPRSPRKPSPCRHDMVYCGQRPGLPECPKGRIAAARSSYVRETSKELGT